MPAIILYPLIAGGVGFGAGLLTGTGATKLIQTAMIGGAIYYTVIKK
jgi:hypothetical protein